MGYPIGTTVHNTMFGEFFASIVAGPPKIVTVVNQTTGRERDVEQQDCITLRRTLDGKTYLQKYPQSTRFLSLRPIDGTKVWNRETGARVSMDPVEGLDYVLDKNGKKVMLTLADLDALCAADIAIWQAERRANNPQVGDL